MQEVKTADLFKKHAFLLLLLALFVAATGALSLFYPFGRDQGIYAYTAERFLAGYELYSETFSFKPPPTTYVHATALAIFGHSMTSIRILDLLWTFTVAITLYGFVFKAFSSRAMALLAGLLYPFFYHQFNYWHQAQTDGWAMLPVVLAFVLILYAHERERSHEFEAALPFWVFAGFLLGVAALFKYTLGAFLLSTVLAVWWRPPAPSRQIRLATYLTSGFALPFIIILASLAAAGSLAEFLRIQFQIVFPYTDVGASSVGLIDKIGAFFKYLYVLFIQRGLITAVLGLGIGIVALKKKTLGSENANVALRLLLLGAAGAALSTFVQGKFFNYHYLPFVPFAAVFSALLLLPARIFQQRRAQWLAVAFTVVILIGVTHFKAILAYAGRTELAIALTSGKLKTEDYWLSRLFHSPGVSVRDNYQLAYYLQEKVPANAKIFIWGYEPMVYFLAQRDMTSRFLYHYPLIVAWAPAELREEFLTALKEDPPEVFVISSRDATPRVTGQAKDSAGTYMAFSDLRKFLESNYTIEGKLNRFRILRRIQPEQEPK